MADVAEIDEAARARVITHNQTSVDGRVAISPGRLLMFDERWPKTDADPYADVKSRLRPRVLLEGSGSFVTDAADPGAPLPDVPDEVARSELRRDFLPTDVVTKATAGWLAVVDSRGRVRWAYKEYPGEEWVGWHLLVLVATQTPVAYLAYLRREEIPYLVAGADRVDLEVALRKMRVLLRADTVVCTGGGRLTGALLRAGLVDEIEIETVPIAVGGTTTPSLFAGPDLGPDARPTPLHLVDVERRAGDRVLLRYAVQRDPL